MTLRESFKPGYRDRRLATESTDTYLDPAKALRQAASIRTDRGRTFQYTP